MVNHRLSRTLLSFMAGLAALGVICACFTWGVVEYFTYQRENIALRQNYMASQKNNVKQKTMAAYKFVMYQKNKAEQRLKDEIKKRTYEAHAIATSIYNENIGKKSKAQIAKMIHDALVGASWDDGRGYYFAEDMAGTELVNRNNPELEGKNIWDIQDCNGVYIMREIIDVAKHHGEGFCAYHWNKPGHHDSQLAKYSFVKYFKPMNWVIGTGKYLKDQEKVIQEEILDYFAKTKFDDEGYVFVGNYDGYLLSYPAKNKYLLELTDNNGKKLVQELINTAKKGGGFVSYVMPKLGEETNADKISYCVGIDDWKWFIGHGAYTDAIESKIMRRSQELRSNIINQSITAAFLMILLVLIALIFARHVSRKISCDLDAFSSFFVNAADKSLKIPDDKINFAEFEAIARSANQMIDDKEKNRVEKERLEKQLEFAHKMEAIGLLAGGVAHDLNNTLSAIINIPEFLLRKMPKDDPARDSLELILEAGKRASAIVSDLQTMNRGVLCENTVLDMNDLIRSTVVSAEFKDLQKNFPQIELLVQLAEESLPIECSIPHINKMLVNLVRNGMEAIADKGELRLVTAEYKSDPPISESNDIPPGEYVLLEIIDDGSGIPDKDLERIFEPFYSKKELGRSGTGLGLAIVWNTVVNHHAFIHVESSESGTTFSIYFPKSIKSLESQKQNTDKPIEKGDNQTILIIDDEELQRKTVCKMLENLGYQADAVASGEEAVEYFKNNQVDLILLDMMLGAGMNGCETYKAILKERPDQKAIIATGYAENDDVEDTLALGAYCCLQKPYLLKDLAKALHDVLG